MSLTAVLVVVFAVLVVLGPRLGDPDRVAEVNAASCTFKLGSRYLLEQNAPDIDDYLRLRVDTGLSTKTTEQAEPIFDSSWLWV